jgi:hypothetical protein
MLRCATTALTALLLLGLTLPAGEPAAKKLRGSWSRTKDDTTTKFTFLADGVHYVSEGPLGKLELEADYAVTKDGKNVYGRVRTVKEGSGPAKGDLFGFGFTTKGDTLTITDWKGTGIVGLAAVLQGDYKMETKKE